MSEKQKEKELWKLVNRVSGEIYADNLTHVKESEVLLSSKKSNKMLIPIEYKFIDHSTMGKIWSPGM